MKKDKSKRTRTPLVAAVLFVILAVLYFVVSTSSCGRSGSDTPADVPALTETVEAQSAGNETEPPVTAAPEESTMPETPQEVVILEDEGELEIIIPEGMESEGF